MSDQMHLDIDRASLKPSVDLLDPDPVAAAAIEDIVRSGEGNYSYAREVVIGSMPVQQTVEVQSASVDTAQDVSGPAPGSKHRGKRTVGRTTLTARQRLTADKIPYYPSDD